MNANVIKKNNNSNIDPYDRMYGDIDTLSDKVLCSYDSDCRPDEYCYKLKCIKTSLKPYIERRDNKHKKPMETTTQTPIVCDYHDLPSTGIVEAVACLQSSCKARCLQLPNSCFNDGQCHNTSIYFPYFICRCFRA